MPNREGMNLAVHGYTAHKDCFVSCLPPELVITWELCGAWVRLGIYYMGTNTLDRQDQVQIHTNGYVFL